MTLVQRLRRQLADLEARIRPIDHLERERAMGSLTPPADWFPLGLFHCQSQYTLAYFQELSALIDKLEHQLTPPNPVKGSAPTEAMVERIGQQFQMLHRFIERRAAELRPRRRHPQRAPAPLPDNLHGLYQRLRQQQEYERRLQEMIYMRQQQLTLVNRSEADKIATEIQQYSARLTRCMAATRQVEERIAQLERIQAR